MSREILFRGKRLDNGEWVEGDGIHRPKSINYLGSCWIDGMGERANDWVQVDPATVGQFTGLCDKNGVKIFEGDIVTYPDGDGGYEYCDETINSGVVTWDDESALFYITNNYSAEFPDTWDCVDEMEVIGNIHDNPELLKEEAEWVSNKEQCLL